jgi:hypothetical protein
MARHGGTGSIEGQVYADWNGNGLQEAGEQPLENIPIRLSSLGNSSTSRAGEFAFLNVPIGPLQIGIDIPSLPVDFDAPQVPQVQVELRRGETRRLIFGLVPLGSLGGRVARDINGNGLLDDGDPPVDGAVLVLDGGARTELARGGRFRFDAIRSGDHTVSLLQESLPEGSAIIGPASVGLTIGKDALAPETTFLVSIHERPEVRRVFPGVGDPGPARPSPSTGPPPVAPPVASEPAERPADAGATAQFAIQVAALGDAARAATLVEELRAAGFTAYLVQPTRTVPDALYRVRIGFFETREEAEQKVRALEQRLGTKLWVIRER